MRRNILIGGAWPYANYLLHIGHLSALLPGDIIARYYRGCNDNVVYVSGTDSHGTPITQRAKKEGKTPEEIAKFYHEEFKKSFLKAEFSYDYYGSTFESYHEEEVKRLFKLIYDNGYIYEKEENEDFCPICNTFLADRDIVGICPHCGGHATGEQCDDCLVSLNADQVLDKKCKNCGSSTISKPNKHLYFKLSAFQNEINDYVDKHKDKWRKNAYGETKKFLEMGLIDRAATRELNWGVEVPIPGYDDKRIYVWIEAVMGYLSTCKKVLLDRGIDFESFIKDKNTISYYAHGKDNIPFHTVIFPALIMAMKNDYNLPDYIVSGEYINMNDEKMSKSKGNLLTVNDLVDTYGAETVRYYMIANGPEKKDVNFTKSDLIQAHNKFLVGVLGNFVNRNLSFIVKKFDGLIKNGNIDSKIKEVTREKYNVVGKLIEQAELKSALDEIFDYISLGNKYYDENTPWVAVKEDLDKFNDITYTCIYMIANIANLINPFMPDTSRKIKEMLSLKSYSWMEEVINGDILINDLKLLFERIDDK